MLTGVNYLHLFVVFFVAWFVPFTFSILKVKRIPAVVAEIVIGFFLGYYFLELVSAETLFALDFLAILGLMFIMFLSGLEIDVDQLTNSFPRKLITTSHFLKNPLLAGILHFSITLVLSYAGSLLLAKYVYIPNVWFFSIILTTTFLGLILPVLKNRGETNTLYGQMIIVAAAVADVIGIILLVFTSVAIRFGAGIEMSLILGLFLVFFLSYSIGKRFKLAIFRRVSYQLAHAASQINIRGALILLFFFVAISQFLGQEGVLLGAFLSGLLLSAFLHKERSLLILKLEGMGYGFFIPVFFIMVGVKFDLTALKEFDQSLTTVFALVTILVFVVKVLPSFIWTGFFGFRKTLAGGFLMASRLGLVIAASFVGMELGAITPGINNVMIIMAIVTCLVSPLMYNLINKEKAISDDKTVIVGGSSVGILLARRLKMHGRSSVIIEKDKDRYEDIRGKGLEVVFGDGHDLKVYEQIGLRRENFVLVNTGSVSMNEKICELLRHDLFHERILASADNLKEEVLLRNIGVDVVDSRLLIATTYENMILSPNVHHSLIDTFENYIVEDLLITSSKMDGKQIKEIPLHRDCMLMLVNRGPEKYIPHGDTYLRKGDKLTIFGTDTAIRDIKKLMSST
jgi:Kef-type K+ transport system membrane component KefB/Trk K+ transport system NAD-binding subunit